MPHLCATCNTHIEVQECENFVKKKLQKYSYSSNEYTPIEFNPTTKKYVEKCVEF